MRAVMVALCGLALLSCSTTDTAPDGGGGDAPLEILIVSGDNQFAQVNSPFNTPLQVQVRKNGSGFASQGVLFAGPSTEPTAFFDMTHTADVVTSATGIAAAPPFKAGRTVGSYIVTATIEGTDKKVEFHLTNTVGAASALFVISGDDQTATLGSAFAMPFRVQLRDAQGNPVPSQSVTFSTPTGAGMASCNFGVGVNSVTVQTDGEGLATSPSCTAEGSAGTFDVTITGPLSTITETMTMTVEAP